MMSDLVLLSKVGVVFNDCRAFSSLVCHYNDALKAFRVYWYI